MITQEKIEEINLQSALRITNNWLSSVRLEELKHGELYFNCGEMEVIKKALKKQTPMKIKEIHVDEYYCPACGAEHLCDNKKVQDKYCSQCGQRFEVNT